VAAAQGAPSGLSVVTVIEIILPASPAAGVYEKSNGLSVVDVGFRIPAPLDVIDTLVAEPPNVLPVITTGVVPQVLPDSDDRVRDGGLAQPQDTENRDPGVVQPERFLTDM
jgi:hypothetical protein